MIPAFLKVKIFPKKTSKILIVIISLLAFLTLSFIYLYPSIDTLINNESTFEDSKIADLSLDGAGLNKEKLNMGLDASFQISRIGFPVDKDTTLLVYVSRSNDPLGNIAWKYDDEVLGGVTFEFNAEKKEIVLNIVINNYLPENVTENDVKNYLFYRSIFYFTNPSGQDPLSSLNDFAIVYKKHLANKKLIFK